MSGLKYYQRTRYLLELIEREKTGSPAELARKLDVTERTVYNIIESLRLSMDSHITYCSDARSYIFGNKMADTERKFQ